MNTLWNNYYIIKNCYAYLSALTHYKHLDFFKGKVSLVFLWLTMYFFLNYLFLYLPSFSFCFPFFFYIRFLSIHVSFGRRFFFLLMLHHFLWAKWESFSVLLFNNQQASDFSSVIYEKTTLDYARICKELICKGVSILQHSRSIFRCVLASL